MRKQTIVLHSQDNIASALEDLAEDGKVMVEIPGGESFQVKIRGPVPLGHKFALVDIARGKEIRKLGMAIGIATMDIRAGEHVHVQNVSSTDDDTIVRNV